MKKLIALLLTIVLALSAVGMANGETCYEILKSYFQDPQQQGSLGTPFVTPLDGSSENLTMIIYNANDKTVLLFGDNASGKFEGTLWSDVQLVSGLLTFSTVCGAWESMSGVCSEGYKLVAGFVYGEEDPLYITNKQDADAAVQAIADLIDGN